MRRTFIFTPKYPAETKKGCYFDYSNVLLDGEVIVAAAVTSTPNLTGNVNHSNSAVTFDVTGGTAGTTCIIEAMATGSLGSVIEAVGAMQIQGVA